MRNDRKKSSAQQQGVSSINKLAQSAKRYLAAGAAILPVELKGKRPVTTNGVSDATTDKSEFKRLVKGMPSYNLGISTGEKGRCIVLDIDPRNGGEDTFQRLLDEHGPLPVSTPCVITGGRGHHYYFLNEPKIPFTRTKLGPGLNRPEFFGGRFI